MHSNVGAAEGCDLLLLAVLQKIGSHPTKAALA
jgi:hypothetical protein